MGYARFWANVGREFGLGLTNRCVSFVRHREPHAEEGARGDGDNDGVVSKVCRRQKLVRYELFLRSPSNRHAQKFLITLLDYSMVRVTYSIRLRNTGF